MIAPIEAVDCRNCTGQITYIWHYLIYICSHYAFPHQLRELHHCTVKCHSSQCTWSDCVSTAINSDDHDQHELYNSVCPGLLLIFVRPHRTNEHILYANALDNHFSVGITTGKHLICMLLCGMARLPPRTGSDHPLERAETSSCPVHIDTVVLVGYAYSHMTPTIPSKYYE